MGDEKAAGWTENTHNTQNSVRTLRSSLAVHTVGGTTWRSMVLQSNVVGSWLRKNWLSIFCSYCSILVMFTDTPGGTILLLVSVNVRLHM